MGYGQFCPTTLWRHPPSVRSRRHGVVLAEPTAANGGTHHFSMPETTDGENDRLLNRTHVQPREMDNTNTKYEI